MYMLALCLPLQPPVLLVPMEGCSSPEGTFRKTLNCSNLEQGLNLLEAGALPNAALQMVVNLWFCSALKITGREDMSEAKHRGRRSFMKVRLSNVVGRCKNATSLHGSYTSQRRFSSESVSQLPQMRCIHVLNPGTTETGIVVIGVPIASVTSSDNSVCAAAKKFYIRAGSA